LTYPGGGAQRIRAEAAACSYANWQYDKITQDRLRNLLLIVARIDQLVVALCFAFASSTLMKHLMVQESSSVVAKMVV
jgi:hypothetical protein